MQKKHVIILGAGFGGLAVANQLKKSQYEITVIDRQNHHLFQPLLYQVATCGLSSPEISQPVRSILHHSNTRVLMAEVLAVDLEHQKVSLDFGVLAYDYLVVALGSGTSYFGKTEWESYAPGLKNVADALLIRNSLLQSFEDAEKTTDEAERKRLMTMAIVGAGPTGVELAGAFAELSRSILYRDFSHIDPRKARIVLIEAAPRIFPHLPEKLSRKAQEQLEALGVEVQVGVRVEAIDKISMRLSNGEVIYAATKVWAAGVRANPIGKMLSTELDRGGRVPVESDLSVPEHRNVFVIGDMALVKQAGMEHPVPGVAPAAMQMGTFVGKLLLQEEVYPQAKRPGFHYFDKGTMATIGRSAAVAKLGKLEFGGFMAWITWMLVHLVFLVGFRNKLAVFMQWIYSYFIFKRGARLIISKPSKAFEADSSA